MKTRKLYYEDAYLRRFTATVLSCQPEGARFRVLLDQTAFFPEEGGQAADPGTLGGVRVLDVREKEGLIHHFTEEPLVPGAVVEGEIDWPERFRKMQNHSGEHILSGVVFRRHGFENTGFHLSADGFTLDFSQELSREELAAIEWEANEAVWADRKVTAWFPEPAALKSLAYRSKLELTENVRIVTIEGVDNCACCAPHVSSTGQIGAIKLYEAMRHRGGMRIRAKCGAGALRDFRARCAADAAVSALLSVPQESIASGVEKLLAERDALKEDLARARMALVEKQIEGLAPCEGDMLLFAQADMDGLRALVNAGMELCGGVCAAFAGDDGNFRFVIGSRRQNCRDWLNTAKDALRARGGGKPEMVSGSCAAARAEIERFFAQ